LRILHKNLLDFLADKDDDFVLRLHPSQKVKELQDIQHKSQESIGELKQQGQVWTHWASPAYKFIQRPSPAYKFIQRPSA
jgi:hypothetical protein